MPLPLLQLPRARLSSAFIWCCLALCGAGCEKNIHAESNGEQPTSAASQTSVNQAPEPERSPPESDSGATNAKQLSKASPPSLPSEPDDAKPAQTPPKLPEGLEVGEVVRLQVPNDRPILVAHAAAGNERVGVYLHGVCGDIDAIRGWAKEASAHLTLIALLGDDPCEGGQRYRWHGNTARQSERIERAIALIRQARGEEPSGGSRVLIGYSQGASRAIALHNAHPAEYPFILLGGLPTEAPASRLSQARSVALVAGQLEAKRHIEATEKNLIDGEIRAKLFELPRAGHGQYGPDGPRVMAEAFAWLFAENSTPQAAGGFIATP